MEHLDPKHYICTDKVDVSSYFKQYQEELSKLNDMLKGDSSPDAASETNLFGLHIKLKELEYLESTCSIDNLAIGDDVVRTADTSKLWQVSTISAKTGAHLEVNKAKKHFEKTELKRLIFPITKQKTDERAKNDGDSIDDEDQNDSDLVEDVHPNEDVLFTVRLYRPFDVKCQKNVKYLHEVAILGSQTLAQLRDTFQCAADVAATYEIESPNEVLAFNSKEEYPSGCIFIEDCFYNDMRHPNSIEYSEQVISWAKRKKVADFKKANMDETKLIDLKLRIGYPYVYQHQSNCEHILIFSDIRFIRRDEAASSISYPYILSVNHSTIHSCGMCELRQADFILSDSDRHIYKNNLICKNCVESYDYKDGEKIGSFKLYPYNFVTS